MTGVAAAIGLAVDILGGIITLQTQLAEVSGKIKQAQDEGRDITDAELAALAAARNKAREDALKT